MARRAGLIAAIGAAVGGASIEVVAAVTGATSPPWLLDAGALLAGAVVAGGFTALVVHLSMVRRIVALTRFLEERSRRGDDLRRLPPLGEDEVGRAASAVNELFASMTSLRVDVIEKGRELAETQEELRLKEALAAKSEELEQRLRERQLLFDILRIAATEQQLDRVLDQLAQKLGDALGLREFAILLREHDQGQERFVLRALSGFSQPEVLLGRSIGPGEGIAGEVAEARRPIIVPDVSADPHYLAFWGEVRREGAFAAFPVLHHGQLIALMALTRSEDHPLSQTEVRLISAIADSLAVAIRHAQLFDELREMSTHDALTGLANRRLLRTQLEMEVDRARRFDVPVCVLLVDIDHFKELNDRCGHPAGDEALRQVAKVMREHVRRVDTVARVGGEEFVLVLPRTGGAEAVRVADKVREQVAALQVEGAGGQPEGRLTVSIGVTELGEGDDPDSLLARADGALYAAKREGRNRVELAAPSLQKAAL
jgi:diguanylate cyclase (GGDEF)-like protein